MTQTTTGKSFLYKIAGMGIKDDMSDSQKRSILMNNILSQNDGMAYFLLVWVFWFVIDSHIGAVFSLVLFLLKMLTVGLSAIGRTLSSKILSVHIVSLIGGPILWAGINSSEHLYVVNIYFLTMLIYAVLSFDWSNALEKTLSISACIFCLISCLVFYKLDLNLTFSDSSFVMDESILSFIFPIFGCVLNFLAYAMLQAANIEASKELRGSIATVQEQSSLQKAIFDSADTIIISTDASGLITGFNKKAEELLGYKASEVLGKANPSIFHDPHEMADKVEEVSEAVGRRVGVGFDLLMAKSTAGMTNTAEWTLIRKDGKRFPGKIVNSAILDKEGQIIGYTKIASDISEQKKTEEQIKIQNEELLASEEELRQNSEELLATNQMLETQKMQLEETKAFNQAMIQSLGLMVITTDTTGTITSFNATAEKALQYDASELLHQQSPAIFHELDEVIARSASISKELGREIPPGFSVFVEKALEVGFENREWTYLRKDGSKIPVSLTITPLKSSDTKELIGFVGVAEDITEKRVLQEENQKSREELQKTKERFELAIAGSSDGIWDWDLITNEVYFSPRWKEMLGYDNADIANALDTFNILLHPDDAPRAFALIDKYLKGEVPKYEIELRMKQKDESYRWILARGIAQKNEQGEPYRLTGSHTDIQANKEQEGIIKAKNEELLASEEELRQNLEELQATQEALEERNQEIAAKEKQIRQIFDGVPAMIYQFAFSPNGQMSVPIASKGAIDIYGVPAEEIMDDARKIIDIVHPDDMANFEESIMVSAQTLTIWNEQVRINTNDGYKWVEGTAIPEKMEDGSIIWSGMVMDITGRKEIELEVLYKTEALQSSEEELRQNFEELQTTQEMVLAEKHKAEDTLQALKETQNQLVQAEKMSSLGQLTAGVAHEINNPVNFISGGSQTLKIIMEDLFEFFDCYNRLENATAPDEKSTIWEEINSKREELGTQEELKEDAEALMMDIEKGVGRVVEIVNGLRNFSRSDNADMALADLHEALDATLLILRNKHKDKVEIIKGYDENIPPIQCFAGQLSQVFMNVIGNAIDAIPEKGEVKINTKNLEEMIEISIEDNGTGIPEAIRKQIFNPFFTTKPVGKGTGLGLSISHGIIEKHQGTMEVESIEGKGTAFIIKIPKNIVK